MAETNVSITINAEDWRGILAKMRSMLDESPQPNYTTTTTIVEKPLKKEKAVAKQAPKRMEQAVPKEDSHNGNVKEDNKKHIAEYTLSDVRKLAQDAAKEKGAPFVKNVLDTMDIGSVSKMPVDMYSEFVELLNRDA